MSSSEVKCAVLEGFKHFPTFTGFTLLESDIHGKLHVSKQQDPDIIESARRRNGPVYLCDRDVCVVIAPVS